MKSLISISTIIICCMLQSLVIAQDMLFVSATEETGSIFVAPNNGNYRFTFHGGAYVNCPPESQPEHPEWWGYTTKILVYKNRPISWTASCYNEYPGPGDWDYELGSWDHYNTIQQAEETSIGQYIDITLTANEYVIFVITDCKKCCFWDNSGGVYIEIEAGGCDFSSEPGIERCFGGIGNQCEGYPLYFYKDENTCLVQGWMSVGSILHDRCCFENDNDGFLCNGVKTLLTNKCLLEFFSAKSDVQCSYYWEDTFGPYPTGNKGDDTSKDLRAPSGAHVYPKDQTLCQSGHCKVDGTGKIIIEGKGLCKYCICE